MDSMDLQIPKPSNRKGSITVLAFTVLAVIMIVGYAFHSYSMSSAMQNYRFKINEKAILMGDAIVTVAKKITENMAAEGLDEWFKKLEENPSESVGGTFFSFDDNGIQPTGDISIDPGKYSELLNSLNNENAKDRNRFEAEVSLTLKRDTENDFPEQGNFRSSKKEFKGRATLLVKYRVYFTLFKSNGKSEFKSGWKSIKTSFEFKRVRLQPPAVRHFSLFAQDASGSEKERGGDFSSGKYNKLEVDAQGNSGGEWLTVNSHNTSPSSLNLRKPDGGNPFKDEMGYILFGTGNDPEKAIYLNITAGNADASESFHLYRGNPGESDFYRLFTSDYETIFSTQNEGDLDGDVQEIVRQVKNYRTPGKYATDVTVGFPFYYLARKDYGYAKEWANHPEFGFVKTDKDQIRANNVHLFGSGPRDRGRFTVVFGNVFRRCLALSGYKQFKVKTPAKKGRKSFEVQAAGIYYYDNFWHLHSHKLYLDKRFNTTGADSNGVIRRNDLFSPLDFWDQRMAWNWAKTKNNQYVSGTWVPISGDGLMGRLIPTIKRLVRDESSGFDLYQRLVGLDKFDDQSRTMLTKIHNLRENQLDKKRVVPPIIAAVYSSGAYTKDGEPGFPDLFEEEDGRLVWTSESEKYSAYMKELILMFYFTAYQGAAASSTDPENIDWDYYQGTFLEQDIGLDGPVAELLVKGAKKWLKIVEEVGKLDDEDKSIYSFQEPQFKNWEKSNVKKLNPHWKAEEDPKKPMVYYFTLPDPWHMYTERMKVPMAIKRKKSNAGHYEAEDMQFSQLFQERYYKDKNDYDEKMPKLKYNELIAKFTADVDGKSYEGPEALFEKYFRRVMTDPAWVLPYNHSLRFGLNAFKKQFFKSDPDEAGGDRKSFMKDDVVPEFRDAIGYHMGSENAYMEKKELEGLGPATQIAIIDKFKDGEKDAYYFAKELQGGYSLEGLQLGSLYSGRCMFAFKNEKEFLGRFLPNGRGAIDLNTSVCVQGDLTLEDVEFKTGGLLIVDGKVTFKGVSDVQGNGTVIRAKEFAISGPTRINGLSLIQTGDSPFNISSDITGNLVVKKFGKVQRRAELNYDPGFLKKVQFLVSFQPYINEWEYKGKADD